MRVHDNCLFYLVPGFCRLRAPPDSMDWIFFHPFGFSHLLRHRPWTAPFSPHALDLYHRLKRAPLADGNDHGFFEFSFTERFLELPQNRTDTRMDTAASPLDQTANP